MALIVSTPKLVTVFGGSGFVGRHIVRTLAKRGYRVRVACRRPDLAGHLQPLGNVGQIQPIQANLRYRWTIERALEGADYAINCVGILHESGRQRFSSVQSFGAQAIAEVCRANGISMTQISAIGADADSRSDYARSKAAGAAAVLEAVPDAVILRPSIIFGPEDSFFNRFAEMARFSPVLPLIGGGKTKFQPVYVADVAEAAARAADGTLAGGTSYDLGGPEVLSFRECMERMLEVIERKRWLVSVPWPLARMKASVLELLPNPLLTRDQLLQLAVDNVVSEAAIREGRTLEGLGIRPQSLQAILPTYLWRFRRAGQYTTGSVTS
ncbi:complex I NDUFA9 subunit family protein [Aquibium carbonis]|uniref:Complex I NDUFA9 subunit family protein n=1 Tax=Aquibium carbonis TaxID=2495581 RepID=A0A429Z1Q0_9HYPH|nr:complex I NDUFA9 subunit family protein [Aquibium carbonis]RST87629.1 complex I NDUFA9 subunit family protein [Aquibium carbonis]